MFFPSYNKNSAELLASIKKTEKIKRNAPNMTIPATITIHNMASYALILVVLIIYHAT
jgi:hypothetical protein